jgi:hypothetical protein
VFAWNRQEEAVMPDEPKDPKDRPPDEQLDELQQNASTGDLSSKERFRKTTHIALLMSYDLIDKLRFVEKETLSLSEDEINARLEQLVEAVEMLRAAYLAFAEQDL